MKEKTKMIGSWHELVEFVENTNPHKETIVLTGYIRELYEGKTYIKQLFFTTKDVNIIKQNEPTKLAKKPIKKNTKK